MRLAVKKGYWFRYFFVELNLVLKFRQDVSVFHIFPLS